MKAHNLCECVLPYKPQNLDKKQINTSQIKTNITKNKISSNVNIYLNLFLMKVTTTSTNSLRNRSEDVSKDIESSNFIQTYDLNDYIKSQSFLDQGIDGFSSEQGVSNLQLNPDLKNELKETFWRTWYHLKHVQAGPFAVYNNRTPIDVGGMFAATPHDPGTESSVEVPKQQVSNVVLSPALSLASGGQAVSQQVPNAGQVQVVQGVLPGTLTPQVVSTVTNQPNTAEELNRSLDTKAVPTGLTVTTSHSGDPNTPPLANVPIVNVIGGKSISAPGVIPSEIMDKHDFFESTNLASNDYYKINADNIGRALIVVLIVAFLVGGCIYRIKTRKKTKKRR